LKIINNNIIQRYLKIISCSLIAGIILTSCIHKKQAGQSGHVIARVGNANLTLEEARDGIPNSVYQQDSLKALVNYRNNWVRQELLVQEAERIRLQRNPVVAQKLKRVHNDALAEALRNFVVNKADSIKVTPQEVQNYYEANKDQFVLNEKYVRFRHLMTDNIKDCQNAKRDLLHGVSWTDVIQKYGIEKQRTLNNSKRYWPISLAVKRYPLLNRYLKVIGINEISPIRLIDGRYHFVQLISRKAKGTHPDINWVFGQIKDWLKLQKRRKFLRTYERNLYLKAKANDELSVTNNFLKEKQSSSPKANVADTISTK